MPVAPTCTCWPGGNFEFVDAAWDNVERLAPTRRRLAAKTCLLRLVPLLRDLSSLDWGMARMGALMFPETRAAP